MFIDKLALNNFRNYDEVDIQFSNGINILYGDNAQGKTNILEAIYMIATTKSHRGNKDREIIQFGYEEAHIRADVMKSDSSHRIDMHLRTNKSKGVAVDLITLKRSAQLFGIVNIVLFSPEDLSIIKNSPAERRRFIDMELCQLNKIYYSDLSNFNKALNQRNNLLKKIAFDGTNKDTLDVWDEQLVKYGIKVISERNNFIELINEIIGKIHSSITSKKENIKIIYEKNVDENDFLEELKNKRFVDLKYQSTSVGPHRDDISFIVNDIDVKKYGSQGQQRTAALSLKLAEIELVRNMIKDNPILLLDDVMSELDSTRRDALLSYISEIQTIITCTGYDDFIKERLSIDKIYKVAGGKIYEQ
ncbi:MAG: DNA replication/repair protein RecF [Clostridium sp.]|nr:DNA replication/repair protein RecF [Clostridium sp.]MCM1460117.1 DNA replication/repair protein RecF [Bacteroides sp.]